MRNKRELYESIMKKVSKIVKRHLNENINDGAFEDLVYDLATEIINRCVDDSGDDLCEWVYDDFLFDINDDEIVLPYLGEDDWYDFCDDNCDSSWDDLDYDTQLLIAINANNAVYDYFDGNTDASYLDYV